MAATQIKGLNVGDGTIARADLNIATSGQAVIRKIIDVANAGVKISSSTGADSGTGDVGMVLDWTLLDARWASQSNLNTHAGLTTTAHGLKASAFHDEGFYQVAGNYAPATQSGYYIQNQETVAQGANMWIAGLVKGLQVQSTVSTGLAPIFVESTTVVRNLNVERLDGMVNNQFFAAREQLNDNKNLDEIYWIGSYLNTTGNGTGNTNFPDAYGFLDVTGFNSLGYGAVQQHTYYDGATKRRTRWGYTWFPWRTMWDNVNLVNPTTGTGYVNCVPKWTNTGTIGNSQIIDSGSGIGIGISPVTTFHVHVATNKNLLVTDDSTQMGTTGVGIGSFTENGAACAPLAILGSTISMNGNLGLGYTSGTEITNNRLAVYGGGYFSSYVTTPTINISTGAAVNKVWQCTNATTGAGQWATVSTSATHLGSWNASINSPTITNGVGTAGQYYRVTTAGTWNSIVFSVGDDVSYNGTVWQRLPAPTIVGNALTKVDDTNVTLTLGGSPATALLNSVSLTLGWTGTLADARIANSAHWNTAYTHSQASHAYLPLAGGTLTGGLIGATISINDYFQLAGSYAAIYLNGNSGTTGQVLTSQGSGYTPTWTTPGSGSMTYPGAGIAVSTGSGWATSIANNSAQWNTAYTHSQASHAYLPLAGGTLTGPLVGTAISMSGNISGAELYRGSSRTLKKNIADFEVNAIEYLNKIAIKSYNLKDGGLFGIGFIAEDTHWWLSGEQQKSHSFGNHLGVLTKAIQDEDSKVEQLKKQVAELTAQIQEIQKTNSHARR